MAIEARSLAGTVVRWHDQTLACGLASVGNGSTKALSNLNRPTGRSRSGCASSTTAASAAGHTPLLVEQS